MAYVVIGCLEFWYPSLRNMFIVRRLYFVCLGLHVIKYRPCAEHCHSLF